MAFWKNLAEVVGTNKINIILHPNPQSDPDPTAFWDVVSGTVLSLAWISVVTEVSILRHGQRAVVLQRVGGGGGGGCWLLSYGDQARQQRLAPPLWGREGENGSRY
jgi:hypothetical protein